jgi:UDP-N-acetylmuramoyl-L-alanyl-D-glutamate--2,6-diaminopimelate ligase
MINGASFYSIMSNISNKKLVSDLFRDVPKHLGALTTIPDVLVNGVVADSRSVSYGSLFVAISGENVDGYQFIPGAIERGAAAIVGTQPIRELSVPYIQVKDSRWVLAYLVAAFFDYPAKKLTVIGVTGTDGKTTTANLIHNILLTAGIRTGMISTVNAIIDDQVIDTGYHVTTPDSPHVQRYLYEMVNAGITHVILEATSHGLAQHRVDACDFDLGVVTNITHEHLDYHGSYQEYRRAKARLFEELVLTKDKSMGNPRTAILNYDDISYEYLSELTKVNQISYGFHSKADVRAENIHHNPDGLEFEVIGPDFRILISFCILGVYNVSNCLASIAATVLGLGVDINLAKEGIGTLSGIPGRMENIHMGQEFMAIVDFAHTPNALMRVLEAARELTDGRVIAIFGSAGLRDKDKRRMMAEISSKLADFTVLTAEDPRTESLPEILEEMAEGAILMGGDEGESFWRVADRGEAIRFGISLTQPGDVLIACGKGHEQSMCFGNVEYPWDDRIALRAAIAEHLCISGPDMPYLPTQDHPD